MCNRGPDTNGSMFFLSLAELKELDGRHCVFGAVVNEDSLKVLREIERYGTDRGQPTRQILITDCGQIYP